MRLTNQSPDQLQTVFGGEFVEEQHLDEAHRNLPTVHGREMELQLCGSYSWHWLW